MRNLTTMLKVVFLTVALTALVACGKGNDKAPNIDPGTGKHPAGWVVANTGGAHPAAYQTNQGACDECHGSAQDPKASGGISGVSCFSASFNGINCHASGPGAVPHSVPYPGHSAAASSNFSYCLGCHQDAANAAGSKPPGCQNCHLTSPVTTPTGCTSCHASPPAGSVYPNIANVHAQHVSASKVTVMALVCTDCHNNLGVGTLDHLNRCRALATSVQANPVVFGSNPLIVAGGGSAFTGGANGQCTNVYCHGAKMPGGDTTGTNRTPTWSVPFLPATITAAACRTCHGFPPLPASGHPGSITNPAGFPATPLGTTCACHANINTQTAAATTYANVFVDKSKHINGTLEVSGGGGAPHSIPLPVGGYPGSSHKSFSNGTGCIGCHQLGTSASIYPATTGAPDCRSCHLNSNPTADPSCSDCHGDAVTGRPNLASALAADFPKRQGQHNNSNHVNRACTVCHPYTTGDTRHGWSNRLKSISAQVNTTAIGWNATNKTCSNSCHGTKSWY